MSRLIIIDGNSLINRAYYALQNPMMTKEGIYTQGIFGFINMLTKINKEYEPTYIGVTFDLKGPTFRHEEYEEYKAGRKKMPPELAMQIPLLKDVLDAMNIKRLEKQGFEADDIIGTVARKAEEENMEVFIITGDKDELQLATDNTKIVFTKKGVSLFEIYDREKMIETYGFTPEQFIDYKGLMGDQSDNIPGVPGVGEKTASKLILEFGSIENVLENIHNIPKEGLRKKLEENKQLALMSKRLATINTSVPIDIDFEEFIVEPPKEKDLIKLYKKLEFNKFLKQLAESGIKDETDAGSSTEKPEYSFINFDVEIVKGQAGLEKLITAFEKENTAIIKVVGDNNRKNKPEIEGIVFGMGGEKKAYYLALNNDIKKIEEIIEILNKKSLNLIGHNLKDDLYTLMAWGLENFKINFDTAICQYLLDPSRSNYDLSTLAIEYFQEKLQDEKEFTKNNAQIDMFTDINEVLGKHYGKWCSTIFSLIEILRNQVKKDGMEELLVDIELPLIEVLAFMEVQGIALDKEQLNSIGKVIGDKLEILKEKIYDFSGEEFNINSPSQLGVVLFEKLGLPPSKKTKTGYSTNAEVLEKLMNEHEIVPLVLEYRTLAKLKGTYVDGLIPMAHVDGKIHANFMQTVTTTGRLSCIEPNLQNIPIRQELGRTIRKAFVPSGETFVLVGADYSQIELRVLAHMSEDESLLEAFNKGEDIHKVTASRVLGIPVEEITVLERSKAKAVNFGVIYGMSAFGLSTEIKVTRNEADRYIKDYYEKHGKVKRFMDEMIAKGKELGYVTTIFNRRRYIKEINASNFMTRQLGERLAMNSPIQGSAADIIKIAMNKVYKALKEGEYESRLILQIHDELIIETHKDELEIIKKLLQKNMEEAMRLKVNLAVDVNVGENWYELK